MNKPTGSARLDPPAHNWKQKPSRGHGPPAGRSRWSRLGAPTAAGLAQSSLHGRCHPHPDTIDRAYHSRAERQGAAMQITCFGAAGEVTGSSYLVTTAHAQVLIDCGMFQGSPDDDRRNQLPRDLDLNQLDAVVLTHAHLDHSGRLPLLARHGYQGPIYATPATIDVAELLLADAARIQESDAARTTRQRQRAALAPIAPLFDETDVVAVMALLRPLPYDEPAVIAPGVTARLVEAGHILGSASVILTVAEQGRTQVAVFSGDLGPRGAPILNDPARIDTADVVVLESTYGDRDHRPLAETIAE